MIISLPLNISCDGYVDTCLAMTNVQELYMLQCVESGAVFALGNTNWSSKIVLGTVGHCFVRVLRLSRR